MFESKITEIAIGQIRGLIEPSEQERAAAFELFVELGSRTTTAPLSADTGSIRGALDSLYKMFDITRQILRSHGNDVAKSRHDGNLTLATIALRVINEVIRPVTTRWHIELQSHEQLHASHGNGCSAIEWERAWPQQQACRDDLNGLRSQIRGYMDSLALIAGTPALTDLIVPNPASAPLTPCTLATPAVPPAGAQPRREMVRWFHPVEGFHSMRASHKGDPKRAGRAPAGDNQLHPIELTAGDDGALWFDYVSDLGDGFDATAAVAWLLTRPAIELPDDRTDELPEAPASLPRGRLLVMGGDQVYPYASREKYRQQTELPYLLTAAAQTDAAAPGPADAAVVAIPGNHDWYGGINLFEDVFVKADTFVGHWRAAQTERWWVVRLSHGWWLWGVDTALDNTLEPAQQDYFQQAATLLADGDRVILCSPVPLWQLRQKRAEEYMHLRQFLDPLVRGRGATMPLFLAGDSHFFAHYRRVDGVATEDHITAGGGGAFLQPTHNLPEQVPYERGAPDYKLSTRWPRPVDSRALATKLHGLRDRQFWWLFAIVAVVHAAYAGLSTIRTGAVGGTADPGNGFQQAARWVAGAWPGWPILLVMLLAMVMATAPNSTESQLTKGAKKYGLIHGAAQAALFVAVAAFGRWVGPQQAWWHFVVVPLIGGVLSTALFVAMNRWINRKIKANDTLAFSSAHLTRYKQFLRMRIDADGDLTVFAVGLDPVGEGWFESLTTAGSTIPPFDHAGAPRLHYVWGKRFAGSEGVQ